MLFTEFRFFLFLLFVAVVYWALRSNGQRKLFLLVASYAFYAGWDYRFLSLIFISTFVDYLAGIKIHAAVALPQKKYWMALSLVVNLGMLAAFKYFNFFVDSFVEFASFFGLPVNSVTLDILLPVGISFYTFQTLSYSLDIYRGHLKPCHSFRDFALFVAFFPQLVAGPIVRAAEFLPQLDTIKTFSRIDFRWALVLFLVGFIKKACIADNLAPFVDLFYADPSGYSSVVAWAAVLAYAVQIYCDFSGYTDMAIAVAGLLGYRLCVNFNSPYLASSIQGFWRRWHISLSSWLRDYLYISLGGNRNGAIRKNLNLLLTMLLGGLWHGASWNFVMWGALHGVGLISHSVWSSTLGKKINIHPFVGVLLTFGFVVLLWVPFRAVDFSQTLTIWGMLLGVGSVDTNLAANPQTAPILILVASFFAVHWFASRNVLAPMWRRSPAIIFAVGYGAFWALAIASRGIGYQPFIYFQF